MYIKFGNDSFGEKLWFVCNYGDDPAYDMVMVLRHMGGNRIFNISSPLMIKKGTETELSVLENAKQLIEDTLDSDWFGPHKVYVVNNADGDKQNSGGFQGGSHNYDNNENPHAASATGRSTEITVVADGVKHTEPFEGYAEKADVYWNTYVQAGNTVKSDGTGREVLVQHHHMTYDGEKWLFDVQIEFFEDVYWQLYYGVQCVCGNSWNGEICYDNSPWQNISCHNTDSGCKLTEKITVRKNGHCLEMYLDKDYGIGDRRYLAKSNAGAFSRIYAGFGKAYFQLVNADGNILRAGQTADYRGYYKFFPEQRV